MASLLEFAYTGQVIITPHNVQELLPAADRFRFLYVKEKCCSYLKRQLTATNCIGIYHFAESFLCEKLKIAVADFMLMNFEEIATQSHEFLELSYQDVLRLVSDERLNVCDEEIVCEAIFKWIDQDRTSRMDHLPQLLNEVRLGLLNSDYLMRKVNAMRAVHTIPPATEVDYSETKRILQPRLPYEILVAVGGWSGGGSTNAIEAYDSRAKAWVNITSIPGLAEDQSRAYHGVIFLNKCLYLIGGFDGVNYFDTVRKLDVIANHWVEEPSMFHKRCYVSVAKIDGKIYALGGMDGQYRLKTAEVYDPKRRVWSILPEMNEQRSDACATTFQNKVYICGGFNGQECLFTAEFYDPVNQNWTWITPMMARRSGVSIATLNDMIYAVGGFDGMNRLRTVEAYCPSMNSWSPVTAMNKARSNFGMDIIDGHIVAVGGFNGIQTTADVELYNASTNTWQEVRGMHTVRSALSCCVMDKLPCAVVRRLCGSREVDIDWEKKSESDSSVVLDIVDDLLEADAIDEE